MNSGFNDPDLDLHFSVYVSSPDSWKKISSQKGCTQYSGLSCHLPEFPCIQVCNNKHIPDSVLLAKKHSTLDEFHFVFNKKPLHYHSFLAAEIRPLLQREKVCGWAAHVSKLLLWISSHYMGKKTSAAPVPISQMMLSECCACIGEGKKFSFLRAQKTSTCQWPHLETQILHSHLKEMWRPSNPQRSPGVVRLRQTFGWGSVGSRSITYYRWG